MNRSPLATAATTCTILPHSHSSMPRFVIALTILVLTTVACQPSDPTEGPDRDPSARQDPPVDQRDENAERVLASSVERIVTYADEIEAALRPVPLLTPGQISAFNRYRNPDHLQAARRLGIAQPVTPEVIARHEEAGRLVRLEENHLWSVRELDYSTALATPDVHALLTEIGERFQTRLAELDLPPLRMEITSVLRTAQDQANLRRVNPNAARGESTHQFGTTVDIAYSSFRAPLVPVVDLDVGEAAWLEPYLRRIEILAAETGAARMSRELQAILGHVLREMQGEGKVMVTMEVRQPVYHITVARRLAS
jgi:hypothetical protein